MSFGWNETNGGTSLTTQAFHRVSWEDGFKGRTLGLRAGSQRAKTKFFQMSVCYVALLLVSNEAW